MPYRLALPLRFSDYEAPSQGGAACRELPRQFVGSRAISVDAQATGCGRLVFDTLTQCWQLYRDTLGQTTPDGEDSTSSHGRGSLTHYRYADEQRRKDKMAAWSGLKDDYEQLLAQQVMPNLAWQG